MMESISKEIVTAQMQLANEVIAPWRSQVLFVLFKIGVFDLLENTPVDSVSIAEKLHFPLHSLKRLVDCGVSLGFLVKKENFYYNAPLSSTVLVSNKPGYMGNWLALSARWYESFGRLEEGIRANRAVEDVNFDNDPIYREQFVKGMIDYARYRGRDILNHLDLSHNKRLLDVGCGPAVYSVMLCENYPDLECTCVDLPHAIGSAKEYVTRMNMADRIEFIPCNYREDESLGQGYDVVFLSHVLHQEDKEGCLELLKKCYRALNMDGLLVVQAMFPDEKGMNSPSTSLHDLLTFLIFPGGENHSIEDTIQWLKAVGLVDVHHQRMSLLNVNSLVVGYKHQHSRENHE